MKFWIDIDDTIADTDSVILSAAIDFHVNHLKRKAPLHDISAFRSKDYYYFSRYLGWDERTVRSFFQTCYPHFLRDIPLKTGAKEAVDYLRAKGSKVILLSARRDLEYHGSPMIITREWLMNNGLNVDDVVLDCVNKADYLKNKEGCFIDDSFDNCRAMISNPQISVFQFLSPFSIPCDSERVQSFSSWGEFLKIVKNV